MNINFVQAAIFNTEGKLLVVKRAATEEHYPNHITYPGGQVENGETLEQALHREIEEEVGLEIIIKHPFLKKEFPAKEKDTTIIITKFICFTQDKNVLLDTNELSDFYWIDPHTTHASARLNKIISELPEDKEI